MKDNIEYGLDGFLRFGLYKAGVVDQPEPNESRGDASGLSKDTPVEACTYSYANGAGGVEDDMDWYVYKKTAGTAETIVIKIQLPMGSPFSGKLKIRPYKNGSYIGSEGQTLFEGPNMALHALSDSDDELYFVVYPVFDTGPDEIGFYDLEISNQA